jgi:lipopolysaccharide exporter
MSLALVGARPLRTVALIVLARLLDPEDFGLVAFATILVTATDLFSGLGLPNALIHSPIDSRKIAFPAFAVTVLFSLALFLVVFWQAAFFAGLMGDARVTPIIRGLSVLIVTESLALVPSALLRKHLKFREVSVAKFISVLVYNGAAVGFALLGFGLWSLVLGEVARSLVNVLVVWVLCPGWDWLRARRADWKATRGLLEYGIQSTGGGFLTFFNTNWDDWLVGRVLGASALGFYSKAYNVSNKGIVGFNKGVISGVFFPSFAKIQDDKERLSRAYIKGLSMAALVITPLALGLFVISPEMVPIVFGEKWVPMVLSLQIFSFMAFFRPLAGSTSPLFLAVGRPGLNVRVGLVLLITMAPLVFLLLDWGIEGVAVAVVVSFVLAFFYSMFELNRLLPGTGPKSGLAILPAVIAGGAMTVGVHLSKAPLYHLMGNQHNLFTLVGMVVIGALIYVLAAFFLQRALILEAVDLVLSVFTGRLRMAFNKS